MSKLMFGLSDTAIKRIASIMKGKLAMDISELTFWDVESSNVESFAYDEEENILYVRFLAKGNSPSTLYAYYDVEPDIFDQFFAADSKGKFIWTHLRDRYIYSRIE